MVVTATSPALIPFLTAKEGRVLKAYKDSGGVWTIGIGMTMLDKVFAAFWLKTRGHSLRKGDTITSAECDALLPQILAQNYTPAIVRKFGSTLAQHQFDCCGSVSFNCGSGTLKDRWANALAAGKIADAAALLRSTRVTAGGKHLEGLVTRRAAEARLLQFAEYGKAPAVVIVATSEDLAMLAKTGYLTVSKPDVATLRMAIVKFQTANGLTADGIIGPATRGTLQRVATKSVVARAAIGAGTIAAPSGGASQAAPDQAVNLTAAGIWLAIAVVGVAALGFLYTHRGAILGRRTPTA